MIKSECPAGSADDSGKRQIYDFLGLMPDDASKKTAGLFYRLKNGLTEIGEAKKSGLSDETIGSCRRLLKQPDMTPADYAVSLRSDPTAAAVMRTALENGINDLLPNQLAAADRRDMLMLLNAVKLVDVAAGLIVRQDRFLICRRPADKDQGGLWEFSGGKVEEGETGPQALIREWQEELNVTVKPGLLLQQIVYCQDDRTYRIRLYDGVITGGNLKCLDRQQAAWIEPSAIDNYQFARADRLFLGKVRSYFNDFTR